MSTEPTSRHEKSSQSNDSEEVLLEDYLEKSEVTTITNNTSNGQSIRANITTNNNTNNDEENIISINEILHCTSSFKVIVTPITLTMILSALCVTFLTTNVAVTYAPYNIEGEENASSSDVRKLGLSLVNSLIIICAIIVMTFIVVLLYKYRFMKCLIGYMILSSAALLALLGGSMFDTFLQVTSIPFDTLSFYFFLYNFAIVGTVSIFYQKGIPPLITKAYLVATSTIVAWRLSSLDPWTAWTLLVLLALYDLCAVLTCCGPLKLLVNMMSKDGAPSMPGLLYEGTLPDGVHRNRRDSNSNNNTGADNGESRNDGDGNHRTTENGNSTQTTNGHHSNRNTNNNERSRSDISRKRSKVKRTNGSSRRNESENNTTDNHGRSNTDQDQSIQRETTSYNSSNNHSYHQNGNHSRESQPRNYTDGIVQEIPLALARLYRLEIIAPQQYATPAGSRYSRRQEGEERRSPIQQQDYSAEELRSNVQVLFQGGGGRIEVETSEGEENGIEATRRRRRRRNRPSTQDEVRYIIIDRHGVVKRKLFVNMEGKIFEEIEKEVSAESDDGDNTIKLGLGDFIFYSVLVSKAAQYSFTTFATCTIAIITGFGGTCILLSLYHKALPALPVSIFLGVIFYLATRFIIQDWIELIMTIPIYV